MLKKRKDKVINLSIIFKPLKSVSGYYYFKKKIKNPKIEINSNLNELETIASLYHEFTHFIFDYLNEISVNNNELQITKKSNKKIKTIYIKRNLNKEQKFAENLDKEVKKRFKHFL